VLCYAGKERGVAFSHLCGRPDLIELGRDLKEDGFVTILGGPQARKDYIGEPDTDSHPHRFTGLKSIVDIAFQGPVDHLKTDHLGPRRDARRYGEAKDQALTDQSGLPGR
jgi:hypothetical protein